VPLFVFERLMETPSAQCTPCPMGSTSPAGSTGEDACHFSMAFTYELAREEYLVAANNLKHAVGPYKSARVCIRSFLRLLSFLRPLDVVILPSLHIACAWFTWEIPDSPLLNAFADTRRCPRQPPLSFPPAATPVRTQ
jgi:hypothetical protein